MGWIIVMFGALTFAVWALIGMSVATDDLRAKDKRGWRRNFGAALALLAIALALAYVAGGM